MLPGPSDDDTVISKKPSPSADGENFEDFFVDVGLLVDGVEVNQLNVVIGGSVVVVVVGVVVVVAVAAIVNASSMNDDRSSTLTEPPSPKLGSATSWLICSA